MCWKKLFENNTFTKGNGTNAVALAPYNTDLLKMKLWTTISPMVKKLMDASRDELLYSIKNVIIRHLPEWPQVVVTAEEKNKQKLTIAAIKDILPASVPSDVTSYPPFVTNAALFFIAAFFGRTLPDLFATKIIPVCCAMLHETSNVLKTSSTYKAGNPARAGLSTVKFHEIMGEIYQLVDGKTVSDFMPKTAHEAFIRMAVMRIMRVYVFPGDQVAHLLAITKNYFATNGIPALTLPAARQNESAFNLEVRAYCSEMDGTSSYTTNVIKVYLDIRKQLKHERAADAKRNVEGTLVLAVKAPAPEEDVAVSPSRNTRARTGGVTSPSAAASSLSFTDGMGLPSDDEDYVAPPPAAPEDTMEMAEPGEDAPVPGGDETVTTEEV